MAAPAPAEVKAAALADLLLGGNLREVARRHGVSHGTLSGWRDASGATSGPLVRPQKKDELGDLVADCLRASLAGFTAIARLAEDRDWSGGQNAHDLAILAGVLFDKSVHILRAIQPDDGRQGRAELPAPAAE